MTLNNISASLGRRGFCLTFVSEDRHSDGEEGAQHVQQDDGSLQSPFILTLGTLGALLDPYGGETDTVSH